MKTFTKNFFKVLFLALISVSLLVTPSCDDDDGDTDPMVGTWVLYELQMGSETLDAADLVTAGYSMTVVFTATAYTAVGTMGNDNINEVGTWTRQDSNHVILTTTDGTETLTKDGEYYTAEFEEGVTGKFKKQ